MRYLKESFRRPIFIGKVPFSRQATWTTIVRRSARRKPRLGGRFGPLRWETDGDAALVAGTNNLKYPTVGGVRESRVAFWARKRDRSVKRA